MHPIAYLMAAEDTGKALVEIYYDSRTFPGCDSRKLAALHTQALAGHRLRMLRSEIPSIGNRHNRTKAPTVRYLASVGL